MKTIKVPVPEDVVLELKRRSKKSGMPVGGLASLLLRLALMQTDKRGQANGS